MKHPNEKEGNMDITENRKVSLKRTKKSLIKWYILFFIIVVAASIIALLEGKEKEAVIGIPIIIVLIFLIYFDREYIHVPPKLIFMIAVATVISIIGGVYEIGWLKVPIYILTGVILSTIGLIITYVALGKMPGSINDKPILIALESFTFGVALYQIWLLIAWFLNIDIIMGETDEAIVVTHILCVIIGCLLASLLYFFGKNYFIGDIVNEFFDENKKLIMNNEQIAIDTKAMIEEGESYSLEFKSTIRTNLASGEQDRRMETAVLKTIVAFLNSEGGTLLVGVADDGNILGVDIESFDNRDKMNLHITHLISARIGDEFIPFIKFYEIDYGTKESGVDKIVVRFDCEPTSSPVFLQDPKDKNSEIYFVRSGPSTVELTGIDLLRYVENRKKSVRRKYHAAANFTELKKKGE